jgi:hypothetical protein
MNQARSESKSPVCVYTHTAYVGWLQLGCRVPARVLACLLSDGPERGMQIKSNIYAGVGCDHTWPLTLGTPSSILDTCLSTKTLKYYTKPGNEILKIRKYYLSGSV